MGHWYDIEGNACHFQEKKGGGTRDTTLRDARKQNLFPSVTEILNIAAKPGLERWKIDQALLSCLTLPKIDGETLDEFKKRAKEDSEKQSIDARDLGGEIHEDIERVFKGLTPRIHFSAAESVRTFLSDYTGLSNGWVPEYTFVSPAGYGGMIDLHNDGWIVDYKTKDFGPDDVNKRMAWDEMCMQLSAYAHGIGQPKARKLNIFISRTHPGIIAHYEWEEDYYDRFECLLKYWQLVKNYKPEEL